MAIIIFIGNNLEFYKKILQSLYTACTIVTRNSYTGCIKLTFFFVVVVAPAVYNVIKNI